MDKYIKHLSIAALSFGLIVGCSDDEVTNTSYQVTVTNLTSHQPLSPLAIVLHETGYSGWSAGDAVSVGLEKLAESGDTTDFISDANADSHVITTATGSDIILPGASESINITTLPSSDHLTLATMLVNTNDGFSGVNALSLANLQPGDSMTLETPAWDAGTEDNSESASTIPGPAAGGTGFNSERDDRDQAVIHPGVISVDDGLSNSALDSSHRFDNPVLYIEITRIN